MDITTIGPVTKSRRDEVRELRDELEHENYNETLGYMLENVQHDPRRDEDS
jgi:hypothetical protein